MTELALIQKLEKQCRYPNCTLEREFYEPFCRAHGALVRHKIFSEMMRTERTIVLTGAEVNWATYGDEQS